MLRNLGNILNHMYSMNKLILSFAFACLTYIGWASDTKCLIVTLQNGLERVFELPDKPEITFNNHTLVISVEMKSPTTIEINNVDYITFDIRNSIPEMGKKTLKMTYLSDNQITIEGLDSNDHVGIYSSNGMKYTNNVSIYDDKAEINISSLPTGTYIINVQNKQSFKIYKK